MIYAAPSSPPSAPWFRDPASLLLLSLGVAIGIGYTAVFPSLTLYESLAGAAVLFGGSIAAGVIFLRSSNPRAAVAGVLLLVLAIVFTILTARAWPAVASFTPLGSQAADGSVVYRLKFAEGSVGLLRDIKSGDFINAGTATGCSFTPSSGLGRSEFEITVRGCTAGTLLPRLLPTSVRDDSGDGPIDPVDADTVLTIN